MSRAGRRSLPLVIDGRCRFPFWDAPVTPWGSSPLPQHAQSKAGTGGERSWLTWISHTFDRKEGMHHDRHIVTSMPAWLSTAMVTVMTIAPPFVFHHCLPAFRQASRRQMRSSHGETLGLAWGWLASLEPGWLKDSTLSLNALRSSSPKLLSATSEQCHACRAVAKLFLLSIGV
jgi:hypothetical protein